MGVHLRHPGAAPDATLTEIHRIFLSTHKNVRVMADDASIARVSAQGGDSLDIDVTARNAGIAHLDLNAPAGKWTWASPPSRGTKT
jgi:hypothetical protein